MQSVSSKIWTRIAVSISYDDNHYATLYSHDITIQIYKCREIRNTDDSPLFRYETFITFLTFSFSTRGETDTNFYYADCSYIAHSQPPAQLDWPGSESNLN